MADIATVLILDDDPDWLKAAGVGIAPLAEHVETATSTTALEAALPTYACEVALIDMNFVLGDHSGQAGLDALDRVQALDPTLAVGVMAAYGGVTLAGCGLQPGAPRFVLKALGHAKRLSRPPARAALAPAPPRERRTLNTLHG